MRGAYQLFQTTLRLEKQMLSHLLQNWPFLLSIFSSSILIVLVLCSHATSLLWWNLCGRLSFLRLAIQWSITPSFQKYSTLTFNPKRIHLNYGRWKEWHMCTHMFCFALPLIKINSSWPINSLKTQLCKTSIMRRSSRLKLLLQVVFFAPLSQCR